MTNLVLYENNDFLIANKPHNIPTVPLKGQDTDGTLLGLLLQDHKEIGEVTGRNSWEYGTIHRLDTPTSGLVLFAKNTRFYNYMLDTQSQNRFLKTYFATVHSSSRLQGHDEIPNDNNYYCNNSCCFRCFFAIII
ncbi:MAG: hypothetical protein HUK24_06615, partial [Sphaerochaetaceae bacterium]|nr:hypothetical protein [Sphaerochaetaceae bacterium]